MRITKLQLFEAVKEAQARGEAEGFARAKQQMAASNAQMRAKNLEDTLININGIMAANTQLAVTTAQLLKECMK